VRWPVVIAILAGPLVASADPESLDPNAGEAAPPATNRLNLRLGGATTDDTGRPTICLDVRVWSGLDLESCGTGSELIHNEPGREMAHFRATWTFLERATARGTGKLRAGGGFAELQVGVDNLGFDFGDPDPTTRGSVAGPEAVVQGQWLVPLGVGIEAVIAATAGVAAFAEADQLVIPQATVQPFVSFEVGVGW